MVYGKLITGLHHNNTENSDIINRIKDIIYRRAIGNLMAQMIENKEIESLKEGRQLVGASLRYEVKKKHLHHR